ncbi:hypothetical protein Tco_0133742 [Tanacetum coccineum]
MSALVVIRRKMRSLQNKLMWVQMVGLQIILVKRLILVDPNAESNSTSTTPIIRKIDKIERLIIYGMATLVDDEGIPLTTVNSSRDHDSDDEVASVDNDMTNFLASKDVGYGTNSLLEQWKESYGNGEYNYDPYNNDMYEGRKKK